MHCRRKEVSEQRRPPLTAGQRADQFVGTAQGREPPGQLLRHFLFRLSGPRGDVCQSGRQSENIFNAMAHLTCKELMAFLRLLAARDVKEDACHFSGCGVSLIALAPGRNPRACFPAIIRVPRLLLGPALPRCGREGSRRQFRSGWSRRRPQGWSQKRRSF